MSTFRVEREIVTRRFKREEMDYDDILEDEDDRSDFCNALNSVRFCDQEPAFWCSFTGGVFRKIFFDGTASPLFVVSDKQLPYPENYLAYDDSYTFIQHELSTDQRIVFFLDDFLSDTREVLHDYSFHYQFSPDDYSMDEADAVIVIPFKDYLEGQGDGSSEEEDSLEMDYAVLSMEDFDSQESFRKALEDLVEMSEDLSKWKHGHYLRFAFRAKNGEVLEEKAFFEKAFQFEGADIQVRKIIANFVQYDDAKFSSIDEETPSLSYAMEQLVLSDGKYLKDYGD